MLRSDLPESLNLLLTWPLLFADALLDAWSLSDALLVTRIGSSKSITLGFRMTASGTDILRGYRLNYDLLHCNEFCVNDRSFACIALVLVSARIGDEI